MAKKPSQAVTAASVAEAIARIPYQFRGNREVMIKRAVRQLALYLQANGGPAWAHCVMNARTKKEVRQLVNELRDSRSRVSREALRAIGHRSITRLGLALAPQL